MRIANIMFGAKRGGIEQAVVDYGVALRSMGHEVTAIIRHDAAILSLLVQAKLPYETLRLPHRWNPSIYPQLKKILQGYDLVILHGNRAGDLTRHIGGLPPVIAVSHSRFFTPHPHFDAVIALSEQRARILKPKLGCPLHVVPNMIIMPDAATRLPLHTPPVVGIMGRFSKEKGFDLFIDALAILRKQGQHINAVIGGDGDLAPALRKYAESRGVSDMIRWYGWVRDKQDFFAAIDLYCMASRTESFPITLLEAMAHGLPVTATDCGGPSAILTPETGIIIPITAEGIAQGITQILADPAAMQSMGRAAEVRARTHFAMEVVARRLDEVVRHVAAQPGPVLNVMFGRLQGGLEQAAVDYAEALDEGNIASVTIASPGAYILPRLIAANATHITMRNLGWWDPFASRRLRRFAKERRARAIICHGNRAFTIARRALKRGVPVIAVAHNYRIMRFPKADACFCITRHVMDELAAMNIPQCRLHFMPNMVRVPQHVARTAHQPPVIGAMGRFIARKGFADWIDALGELKKRNIPFRAILGGEGEERWSLQQQICKLELGEQVELTGWIEDKDAFYRTIDLFVTPSLHEPFGIVLIEAMAHQVPLISTAVEGPREIVDNGADGLLVPSSDPTALADAMQQLLDDPPRAQSMAQRARQKVEREYSIQAMAARLRSALEDITARA